ncbi:hypothetical protein ABZ330_21705 [Streptomyces sp. NPDC006172]|uniref:hypothetical protein n=1 Tax=Streptomyces sp. NPDC006172 TaxID=3154470 RepID=UPI0033FD85FA
MTAFAAAAGMTTSTLTTAGLAVGVGLLAVEHVRWWRGGGGAAAAGGGPGGGGAAKDPKALIPFWFGVAFGTLAVACPAGMLGTGAGFLRWGGNGLGGWVMSTATGRDASAVANASAPALNENGAIVVTALVIVLWLLRKQFAKVIKGKWWRGVWSGTLLAIGTGTFAMIGNIVVPGANDLGAWAINGLVHGTLL